MRILLAAPLLLALLAGCTDGDGDGLVRNACTDHPNYGTGNPVVTFETSHGNLTGELYADKVPNTAMNFVKLIEDGTLDGTPFHRIITDFMMQGGDYEQGNGYGGTAHPDCAQPDGNIVDEFREDLRHDAAGTFSMANTGHSNSGSSQFFVTFVPTPHLDAYDANGNRKDCGALHPVTGRPMVSCHAVFGRVTAGFETLERVNDEASSSGGTPRVAVTLLDATITWPAATEA